MKPIYGINNNVRSRTSENFYRYVERIYAIDWYELFDRSVCIRRQYVTSREIAKNYLYSIGFKEDVNGFWYDNTFPYEAHIVECIPVLITDLDYLKKELDADNNAIRQRRIATYDL